VLTARSPQTTSSSLHKHPDKLLYNATFAHRFLHGRQVTACEKIRLHAGAWLFYLALARQGIQRASKNMTTSEWTATQACAKSILVVEPYAMIQMSVLLQPHKLWLQILSQTILVCFSKTPGSHSGVPQNLSWKTLS